MDNFKLWYLQNAADKCAAIELREPLYGIGDHRDTLDLSTGIVTRHIKKITLNGSETISGNGQALGGARYFTYTYTALEMTDIIDREQLMTEISYPMFISDAFHMRSTTNLQTFSALNAGEMGANNVASGTRNRYIIFGSMCQTAEEFKALLASNPVTLWYVLAQPTTETATVPVGLSGTAEGYLYQNGKPSPEERIYPQGNGEARTDGKYLVKYHHGDIPDTLRKYLEYKYKVRADDYE